LPCAQTLTESWGLYLDVKKVGRIPDGGGWRIHGRNSAQKRAVDRVKTAGAKAGYLYLHSIVGGFSRLAYAHKPSPFGTSTTTIIDPTAPRAANRQHPDSRPASPKSLRPSYITRAGGTTVSISALATS
jgi:hypothetical protein